jgi:hypothetical protein
MVELDPKKNNIMTSMLSKDFYIDIKLGGISDEQLSN